MAMTTIGYADVLIGSPPFGMTRVAGTMITGTSAKGLPYTVSGNSWLSGSAPKSVETNCKNCGACYNRWDDDCNYCGTIRV